jgi:hypothetical protein
VEKPVGNQPGNTSNIGHVQILDRAGEADDVLVEATSISTEHAIVNAAEVIFYILYLHMQSIDTKAYNYQETHFMHCKIYCLVMVF